MSTSGTDHGDKRDALEAALIQDILDMSPEALRAELSALGQDPDAMIAEVDVVLKKAIGHCRAVTADGDAAAHVEDVRSPLPDPFAMHDVRGLRAVSSVLGCNMNFLGRLKDRMVRTEDLTHGFLAKLAEALGSHVDALSEFLSGPAQVPAGARFKADGKPAATEKQSLAEALDASGMPEDKKRRLLAL